MATYDRVLWSSSCWLGDSRTNCPTFIYWVHTPLYVLHWQGISQINIQIIKSSSSFCSALEEAPLSTVQFNPWLVMQFALLFIHSPESDSLLSSTNWLGFASDWCWFARFAKRAVGLNTRVPISLHGLTPCRTSIINSIGNPIAKTQRVHQRANLKCDG